MSPPPKNIARIGFIGDEDGIVMSKLSPEFPSLRSRDELGLSAAEIARHLGVNTSAITMAIDRAERGSGWQYHD